MIGTVIQRLFGTRHEREIKKILPVVEEINNFEPGISKLTDIELQAKTGAFKSRLSEGADLNDLLPEAFAVVREASKRILGMRHFDVQLIGGIFLHNGRIIEMKTGEGKTLVATLPAYLNALTGKGVHVITVNDYLARRDSEWMGRIYKFLGLTVGTIVHDLPDQVRKEAYLADITYGTNNEFGFDYLRDNMKFNSLNFCQRKLHYCIIDEVDSILIDEARTPLIISGSSEESTDKYYIINQIIPLLKADIDYVIDEKLKSATLTEEGNIKLEKLLKVENMYSLENIEIVHHVVQALKAHTIFKRDVDYVVKDGEVVIVDEFTGRLMFGRRWSDGLHQAVEAKEGVKIAQENQTLATITFQNYFRMYEKLSGMTGTADTEAVEFSEIYKLEVQVIPPNKPMIRKDNPDVIYRTVNEKFKAILNEIEEHNKKEQPVLVGTISIENSEKVSAILKKKGIKHSVLNAKYHEKEAEIIAQAGRASGVTIATNMAGRGTDILLGGNFDFFLRTYLTANPDASPENIEAEKTRLHAEIEENKKKVISAGGLHIIGTERHEARRIDNQLRGRAGRQGDPGSSRFFLSLEDDLLRIFGSDRISSIMERMGMEEDVPIEHRMVSKAIENAQKKVEANNYEIRKHLLDYDNVMNKQREVIYGMRFAALQNEDIEEELNGMFAEVAEETVETYCPENAYAEAWDLNALLEHMEKTYALSITDYINKQDLERESLINEITERFRNIYIGKKEEYTPEIMLEVSKVIMLRTIDTQWKDHLLSMDHLKEGIGLRGYGQKDPLVEYKREGFDLFADMIGRITRDVVEHITKVKIATAPRQLERQLSAPKQEISMNRGETAEKHHTVKKTEKVGRNDLCPCGSGKKYKKCCGT